MGCFRVSYIVFALLSLTAYTVAQDQQSTPSASISKPPENGLEDSWPYETNGSCGGNSLVDNLRHLASHISRLAERAYSSGFTRRVLRSIAFGENDSTPSEDQQSTTAPTRKAVPSNEASGIPLGNRRGLSRPTKPRRTYGKQKNLTVPPKPAEKLQKQKRDTSSTGVASEGQHMPRKLKSSTRAPISVGNKKRRKPQGTASGSSSSNNNKNNGNSRGPVVIPSSTNAHKNRPLRRKKPIKKAPQLVTPGSGSIHKTPRKRTGKMKEPKKDQKSSGAGSAVSGLGKGENKSKYNLKPRDSLSLPKKDGSASVAVSAGKGASVAVSASRRNQIKNDKKKKKLLKKNGVGKKGKKNKGGTSVAVSAGRDGASVATSASRKMHTT